MFTIPPLASVGLTEEQAKIKGLEFDVISGSTDGWYTSKRLKMKNTGFKVLVDKKSGMIQGAHICAPHTEETINIFAYAIKNKVKARDLKTMVYAYPTSASDIAYMVG